jgi:hypothetical protein
MLKLEFLMKKDALQKNKKIINKNADVLLLYFIGELNNSILYHISITSLEMFAML